MIYTFDAKQVFWFKKIFPTGGKHPASGAGWWVVIGGTSIGFEGWPCTSWHLGCRTQIASWQRKNLPPWLRKIPAVGGKHMNLWQLRKKRTNIHMSAIDLVIWEKMSFSQPVQNEMMIFSGDVTSQLDTGWLTLSETKICYKLFRDLNDFRQQSRKWWTWMLHEPFEGTIIYHIRTQVSHAWDFHWKILLSAARQS